jgi:hypothetical protein
MLTEQRIKEAESNVRAYLEDGLLKKVPPNQNIGHILLLNAKESLQMAEIALEKSPLWTIVCSYYAMFYIANAILLRLGKKVGPKIAHKVTSDSLIVFVRDKLQKSLLEEYEETQHEALDVMQADEVVEHFDLERQKRSHFQYSMTEVAKLSKAKTSLERAKRFHLELSKL